MSISSESSRQTATLPRQDTTVTVSSLSTSYTYLETGDSYSSTSKSNKNSNNNKNKRKNKNDRKKYRRHSNENFQLSCDPKTLKTLRTHYYPEEQCWGYVIVAIASIVQIIDHGLQISYGLLLVIIFNVFGTSNDIKLPHAGELIFFIINLNIK